MNKIAPACVKPPVYSSNRQAAHPNDKAVLRFAVNCRFPITSANEKHFFSAFLLSGLHLFSQETHNGLPVIKATKSIADYRFNRSYKRIAGWQTKPYAGSARGKEPNCFPKEMADQESGVHYIAC
jgi:hypothetical protein